MSYSVFASPESFYKGVKVLKSPISLDTKTIADINTQIANNMHSTQARSGHTMLASFVSFDLDTSLEFLDEVVSELKKKWITSVTRMDDRIEVGLCAFK